MTQLQAIPYTHGKSLSDLFADDVTDGKYCFILNYPATATWAVYPNTKKYLLQDGSDESTKTSYDKISQKEPWKNLAVLGDQIPGIIIRPPRNLLIDYWRDQFSFEYSNMEVMQRSIYLDYLSQTDRFDKVLSLFPFDSLAPHKHAVDPDVHYHLLSKVALAELGVPCPNYKSYDLRETALEKVPLPKQFPYLIKTSHGLSGEGTYIIRSKEDLDYCIRELEKYLESQLLTTIIVSEFVKDAIQNYCVQFYVGKTGTLSLIGVTRQLVTLEGNFLGGLIHYNDPQIDKFFDIVTAIGRYAHQKGYFGIVGCDVLEDKAGGLYAIDANFRINGSTPLCLQRHSLLECRKEVAKYSSDYQMNGTLDSILVDLKAELDRKDFIILSALEKLKYGKIYTEIYGIVTGETIEQMQKIEQSLAAKGLHIAS